MSETRPCVYILASRRNGMPYVGVTSDLVRRVAQHRSNAVAGFVHYYGVYRLAYAAFHAAMADAMLARKAHQEFGDEPET